MSKVDSTKHKPVGFREFLIGDLFDVKLSDGDNRPADLEKGIIPLISAGDSNNGVVGYFKSPTKIFKENSITVDMFGYVYYQPVAFQTVSHGRVSILQIKNDLELSENSMLYLATAIKKVTSQSEFGFSKMASSYRIKSLMIQLPVLTNNQPDYEYMDYFVEELKHKYVEELDAWWSQAGFASLSDTLLTGNDRNVINNYRHAQIKPFMISELFEISTGSLINADYLTPGDFPRLSVKTTDNGILGYYNDVLNDQLTIAENFISVNFMGVAYYHVEPTSVEMKVHILKNEHLDNNIGLYLVAILNKYFKGKYTYGDQLSSRMLKNDDMTIQLPVDINNQPDYDLINQYMQVMKKLTVQTHRAWLDEQLAEYQSLI